MIGTVEGFPAFERKTELQVSPSMFEIREQQSHVQITNHLDHTLAMPQTTTIAVFKLQTPNQAKNLQPMVNEKMTPICKFPDEADSVINQLFQDPSASTDKRWYPTLETCVDLDKLNRIERLIYDGIIQLRESETLNPTCDDKQRQTLLKIFSWDDSILNEQEQERIEALLVECHIIAGHRLEIGIETGFKIKLRPKHDNPLYAHSHFNQPEK